MLIVLDGQPGAGKTSLLDHLGAAGVPVIGEVVDADGDVVRDHGRQVESPAQTVANMPRVLESDLTKHRMAGRLAAEGTVVMDRNYVFTLAVSLTLGMLIREDLFSMASRWFREHRAELVRPDAYLVLDLPPELSDRRTGWSTRNPGNPMTFVEYRRKAAAYSDTFRRVREPDCPVRTINAMEPAATVAERAQTILAELKGKRS